VKWKGFPSNWLDGVSKTRAANMIGNSIIPEIAYIIMQQIKGLIDENTI
jgi:site-specific DNA-cytosine methylase